jgi:cell division protein ZapA
MTPQVMVVIGGRSYRLACNPGEEDHLLELAKYVDSKIGEMHSSFRDMGDQRIVVMAALAIADELHDLRRKAQDHDDSKAQAVGREAQIRASAEARVHQLEATLTDTAKRVEALVDVLNGGADEDDD